jgi:NADH:ubiquinone oxidoreductase subunit 2 (subunit N)
MIGIGYIISPFQNESSIFFLSEFSPFSVGAYLALSIGIVLVEFITIKEADFCSERSFNAFISLLLVQAGSFLIISGVSWLLVFFGYILLFSSFNYYVRIMYNQNEANNQNLISPYFIMNALSIVILFVGIICYNVTENSYHIHNLVGSQKIWEFLSLSFILFFLYIQLGCPPFHFWIFSHSDQEKNSSSQLLIVVQRGIAIVFLIKILDIFRYSDYSKVLLWIFIISGIIFTFWGILASMTEDRLQKLVSYVSLSHLGFTFLLTSFLFSSNIDQEIAVKIYQSLCYLSLAYILLYSFTSAITSIISKGYGTTALNSLRGLGRRTYILPLLMLLSFLLLFAFPIVIGYQANLFNYSLMPSSLYFIMVLFDIQIVLSLVYIARILKILYFERRVPTIRFSTVEPGIYLALLFSLFLVIIFLIFSNRIFEFCLYMMESV